LYPDALAGNGIHADALYVNTVSSFEQLLVLRTQLPDPGALGLDEATAMLQVVTEFFDVRSPNIYPSAPGVDGDEHLDFGVMHMVRGYGFAVGYETNRISVEKHWFSSEGRLLLAEQVRFSRIAPLLAQLPPPVAAPGADGSGALRRGSPPMLAKAPLLPPRRQPANKPVPFNLASTAADTKGFALDFTVVTTQTNMVFMSDTTFVITNAVTLSGSNVWEAGTVLRFGTNGSLTVAPGSQITWLGTDYRPVLMTSLDDSSVGEYIAGVTPPRTFAKALDLSGLTNVSLGNFRISFAQQGIVLSGASVTLINAQFAACQNAIAAGGSVLHLRNALFAQTLQDITAQGGERITAENVTSSTTSNLIAAPVSPSGVSLALTNCILANVTNVTAGSLTLTGAFNGFYSTAAFGLNQVTANGSPFQSIGGGACYLTNDCEFRNAGTTNIDSALLAELGRTTTYPPILPASNVMILANVDMLLFPQAGRDAGQPTVDLGYHYCPIDFAFSWTHITNSTVTVLPGTVLTLFGSTYGGAFQLEGGGHLLCQGTPTQPVRFVAGTAVQEQSANSWCPRLDYAYLVAWWGPGPTASINCRFTDFSSPAQDAYVIGWGGNTYPIVFQDCQFHGGYTQSEANSMNFTNCVLDRFSADMEPQDNYTPVVRSCTWFGGAFCLAPSPGTNAIILDNLFDGTSIPCGLNGYTGGYNAAVTNFDHPGFPTDIVLLSSPSYRAGPLGNFYQPANTVLFNADTNTTADQVGLYRYTMYTNLVNGYQIKETNSCVDIGFHYVATDANGHPVDSNGDGTPDYLSDLNGNGLIDSGEIGWNFFGDQGLRVLITRPSNGSTIP
jgi:hypothetical protein